MRIKNKFSLLAVFLTLFVCIYIVFNKKEYKSKDGVIAWDVISYYGYLPATFIYHDLSLSYFDSVKTDDLVKEKTWFSKTPNGGKVFKTSMGVAMMYAPYFFIADFIAPALGYAANGYTPPYAFALVFSGLTALFIGLLVLRKLLLNYYSDWVCTFTLLIIALATNLLWYSTMSAAMSHVFSFCLFSIFLYVTEKWYRKQGYWISILLGLTLGLISLARPTNCIIFIVFLLWGITNIKDVGIRWELYRQNILKLLIIAICAFLVWVPQMLYWKHLTGECFFYSYNDNETFFFNDPQIWNVLFGFRKGWLIYTPVMVFALIGVGFLWKYNKKWALAITVFFLLNLYIVSSWWCWWYGGSFGMRALIDSYPLMAIGLAAFFAWIYTLKKKKWKILLIVLIVAISLRSVFHTIQYNYAAIHFDSMNKKAFILSFWSVRTPGHFYETITQPDYSAAKEGKRDE